MFKVSFTTAEHALGKSGDVKALLESTEAVWTCFTAAQTDLTEGVSTVVESQLEQLKSMHHEMSAYEGGFADRKAWHDFIKEPGAWSDVEEGFNASLKKTKYVFSEAAAKLVAKKKDMYC